MSERSCTACGAIDTELTVWRDGSVVCADAYACVARMDAEVSVGTAIHMAAEAYHRSGGAA